MRISINRNYFKYMMVHSENLMAKQFWQPTTTYWWCPTLTLSGQDDWLAQATVARNKMDTKEQKEWRDGWVGGGWVRWVGGGVVGSPSSLQSPSSSFSQRMQSMNLITWAWPFIEIMILFGLRSREELLCFERSPLMGGGRGRGRGTGAQTRTI